MKTIRKLKWKAMLMLALLCFGMGFLRAQERATTVNWSGEVPGQTISTATNVYLTGDVTLNGTITVAKGVELNIYAEGANRTIYRGNFNDIMFDTELGDGTLEGGILRFNRDERTYTITIDGGAQFQDNDAKKELLNSPHGGRTIVSRGRLRMHHVIIQNIYLPNDNAGAITFDSQGSKPNGDGYNMAVSDLIIRAVKAATVIYFESRDHHQFGDDDFVGVEIYNCSSLGSSSDKWGGTIRAVGGVKSNLVLNACSIHDNIAKYGGAVFWNAGNGTSCKLKIIGNTKIYNNEAIENGGGIQTLSTVDLQSAEIYNNRAKNGGGFCVDTYYGGNDNYSGEGFEVKIVDGVSIHDNTADERGGGIYMLFQPTNDVGFDAAGNPISPQFKFEMTGGSIYNNHAPIGAGVAIYDMAPNRHLNNRKYLQETPDPGNPDPNPAYNKWSGEYVRNVYISGGNIYDNTPESESTDTKGAGMYIAKAVAADVADGTIGYTYGDAIIEGGVVTGVVTAGSITINPTGGNIYGNQANNGSGSGMYIVDEMNNVSPYYSVCNVNVGAVNIYGNTCSGNGAGMYVQNGIVTVSGAKVGETSTGASSANTTTGLGGGIYVNNTQPGVVTTINGGTKINNNGASNGAGAYIAQGKVVVQDASTEIASNTASTTGGGIYVANGNLELTNAKVNSNKATSGNGGGAYIANGEVTIDNATLSGNQATAGNGGGICINSSSATNPIDIKNGTKINGTNEALNGAGVYVAQGAVTIEGSTTQISGNQATQNGGGIYMNSGTVTVTNAKVEGNVAKTANGGGIYVGNGDSKVASSVTLDGATVDGNEAATSGGGIYVAGNVTLQNGAVVKRNEAAASGGGIYVADGGNYTMTGGAIGGTTTEGNKTTGNTSYGGGLYMGGGTATITGGSISGNQTDSDGMGGGIYMNGGTCTLSGGATIGGASASYANSAKYGGGIYSRNGSITVKGGIIDHNTAVDGGGIYSNGPDATVKITKEGDVLSYMRYNRAGDEDTPGNGGGIYANRGTVEFTDGNILYNHASEAGGGMYVNDEGTLLLKGNAILNKNHVPTGKKGGGVYLRGTVKVGEEGSKAQSSVKADMNFAHKLEGAETAEGYTPNDTTRNNIYLPDPVAHAYTEAEHRDVIWVYEGGIADDSHVGFSVPHNHVPVIYCKRSSTSWGYLERFTTGDDHDLNTVLFDDTQRYKSVHYTDNPYFDPDHVYLYGFWPEAVTSLADVPAGGYTESNDTIAIGNEEGFAWLISVVNGRYDKETGTWPVRPDDLSGKTVTLESDLDMKAFGWVPIGFKGNESVSTPAPFRGTFNGKGHTIEGINGLVYGQGNQGVRDFGLFGYVNGGTIENVFLKNAEYYVDDNPNLVLGLLASELEGTANVNNSEASGKLVAQSPNAIMGGLVGRTGNGGTGTPTIHSAIAIADMTGGTMGGLVGHNVKGDVLNSFANTKFTRRSDATSSHYCGGLVAVNRGRVENCYAREQDGSSHGSYFGSLVGDNAGGTVRYSYAPQPTSQYTVTGKEGVLEGVGTYGTTQLPYLYAHRDTQVTLANGGNDFVPAGEGVDKQMLIALNAWVNQDSLHRVTYTKWGRPWQESNTLKPLNDDYPILRMPMANAVASSQGDPYLDYNDIDVLLEGYQATGDAIWMYNNSETVTGDNEGSAAKLYIAEDVALLNANPLKAYVGITLDNSAGANGGGANPTYGSQVGIETDETDWHMIATPLSDAHVGIDYQNDNTAYDFSWGHPDDMPYYRFYPKGHDMNGYFPSMRYDWASENSFAYNPSAASADGNGNYYKEWDFYSYYEPTYHWINFKRNKASHHYLDTEDHPTLTYTNEEVMVPGKGYFAATREETFLQCQGHLNADEVIIGLTHTPNIPRHGYNLIGNPYQAYLNFDAFADANWGDDVENIWGVGETPSYTILDEDELNLNDSVETVMGRKPVFYKTFSYECSDNPDVNAGGFIHPHQGFFVRLGEDRTGAKASFEPAQRNATDTVTSKFRGNDHIDYPLVNLFAIEENGAADVVTVELGRPDQGGAALMQSLRVGNGKIWCHYNDKDYAIAYTQPGISEVAIRFESVKDTEYTMRWSTRNGEFSYLHLIDNVTGADVDCLTTDEYKFSASTSDYKSRFRLVFGYTGIEEPEEVETSQNFAFVMGDELVVTGEGVLQVFDMTGRMVTSQELHGVQTTVSLPNAANGVYVLRLTEGKQSRIQKMVISK